MIAVSFDKSQGTCIFGSFPGSIAATRKVMILCFSLIGTANSTSYFAGTVDDGKRTGMPRFRGGSVGRGYSFGMSTRGKGGGRRRR